MKTYLAKEKDIKRNWHLVDAKDKVLGRVAVKIAGLLSGKRKATYTPHVDSGDEVVVINADKIKTTGRKLDEKLYTHYSGYPGGLRTRTLKQMLAQKPEEVIRHAVKGMLPKNKLAQQMIGRLKVYKGASHPHAAQNPKTIEV